MNEEQALAEIVQTLTVDHGCHAVILYGSRARGDFQPTSDWDVAGIREAGATAPLRVANAFHGAWLDAFVYAEAAFTVIDPELLRFLPARILVDQRGFAKTLIERVDALDQKGPPPLPEGEDEMVRVWYAKMLVRIARGDLESKYRRVELLFQALDNYFKLRGLWYRGRYLHDGSVTTLEEMFNPARLKPDFVSSGFRGVDEHRVVPGHEFGLSLKSADRDALIAFLKTL